MEVLEAHSLFTAQYLKFVTMCSILDFSYDGPVKVAVLLETHTSLIKALISVQNI